MAPSVLREVGGVQYSVGTDAELPELSDLIAESFARREPLALALAIDAAQLVAYLDVMFKSPGRELLTVVGREVATGVMVGGLLAMDSAFPPPDGLDSLPGSFDPLADLFAELESRTLAPQAPPGETVHCLMLAVDQRFTGRSIAAHLVAACLANAAARGYRRAVTEATGRTSQHVFSKLGFVAVADVEYGEYLFRGRPVFAPIAEHGSIKAMVRQLAGEEGFEPSIP